MFEADLIEVAYEVPRGTGKGQPLRLNLAATARAQHRLRELATVNAHGAPELHDALNAAWTELRRTVVALTYEFNMAEAAEKAAHGAAILSVNDDALAARGFKKGSADLRDAIAQQDPNLAAARERLAHIRAARQFFDDRARQFDRALSMLKTMHDDKRVPLTAHRDQPGGLGLAGDHVAGPAPAWMRGGAPPPAAAEQDEEEDGFAEPNYGGRRY